MKKESVLRVIGSKRVLIHFFLGFVSGLPLLLTGGTLSVWMDDVKVDLKTIGLFALVGIPYGFKFVWAPLFDRYVPPFLGRRKGWLLVSQLALVLALVGLSATRPEVNAWIVALFAVLVAFFSATQDIVIDAYRREILRDEELGLGSSLYVWGYRVALLVAGAFAIYLATLMSWKSVYLVMAAIMAAGIVITLLADEPKVEAGAPKSMKEAVVSPFVDYFKRDGAIVILLFILCYKLGDNMAAQMTAPFILKSGLEFSKEEYAAVVKGVGFFATVGGGLLGGLLILKWGINRSLWIFGGLQMVSTAGFAILAAAGKNHAVLASVIGFENVASGMGTSAFVAFMGSITNRKFTATQYALLTSLMAVPRFGAAATTGYLAEALGWTGFFLFCTVIALPGLGFLALFAPWKASKKSK